MDKKVAFYGMDLYSFYSSMDSVIEYLEKVSPEDAKLARKRYSNFERFQGEPAAYGYAAGFGLSKSFEKEVIATLTDLKKKEEVYLQGAGGLIDGDELFYTQQNAEIVKNAEEYYRKMYQADDRTWNLRDKHMVDSVTTLLNFHTKKV
jgi:erythromycin esterase-like protein